MMSAVAELLAPPPTLAFIEGIGAMEMMLVAVIGLLLFGGKGLPDMARTFGKVVREFKKASSSVEAEVKRVMNEEPDDRPPPRPKRPAPAPLTPPESAPDTPGRTEEPSAPAPPASGPAA